jgi:hypothetical protein
MSADENWTTVSQFVSDLRNVSRLGAYVDTVVDIFESGAWRRYTDATGRTDDWRECEFDYFLIACGAQYGDVQRLLTWDRARAAEVAGAMESDDRNRRRPLTEASASWRSPTTTTLVDLAGNQGWTKAHGVLRIPPAPARARTLARHGVTMDEHARQQREAQIPPGRRSELDARVQRIAEELSEIEMRYIRDAISQRLRRGG